MLDATLQKLQPKLMPIALLFCRLSLGGMFAVSGFGKVMAELREGLGTFRGGSYGAMQPSFVPDLIATPYGYLLPWGELIFGVLLLVGLFGRVSAAAVLLMLGSILTAQVAANGITAVNGPGPPFNANYILLAVSFLLLVTGPGKLSVDGLIRKKKTAR